MVSCWFGFQKKKTQKIPASKYTVFEKTKKTE